MPGRRFTDQEEEQIATIYKSGISARAIARVYGSTHHKVITSALKRQGVKQRSPAERNRLYALNAHAFDNIDNEHAAYWWGFLYADGHVSRRSLIFALKWDDRAHVQKLGDFMESESPIHKRHSQNDKHNARIEFTDGHLAARMRELGMVTWRTDETAVQRWLPESLTWHWIRGFFDGDGSARKDPNGGISFCGRKSVIKWIREIAARDAGTNPNLSVRKHKIAMIFYLTFSGRIQALKISDCMYKDATIWMERKRNVIDGWPQKRGRILPPQCKPGYIIKRKRSGE